jgi:hypothetical protein
VQNLILMRTMSWEIRISTLTFSNHIEMSTSDDAE